MMASKRFAPRIVATFGAGLAGAYLAPSAEGSIISLTPSQTTASLYFNDYIHLAPASFTFRQFNDLVGKTLDATSYVSNGGLAGFRFAPASQTITTGQTFDGYFRIGPGASGTETLGFLTTANQVGWLKLNFGGSGGAITYLAAAYNDTPGGTIHSGSLNETAATVPEPGSLTLAGLGLLALGSRGVRRLRGKRRPAPETVRN